MRINELTLSKDITSLPHTELFKKYGWREIRTGAESTVAQHPDKDYVLKIYNADSKYNLFVKFVRHNQDNLHLPKFSIDIKQLPGDTNFNYVRMEMLQHLPDVIKPLEPYIAEIYYFMLEAIKHNIRPGNWVIAMGSQLRSLGFKNQGDYTTDPKIIKLAWKIINHKPDASWMNMIDNFIADTKSHGISKLDLQSSNFMLRGNVLVLTDPYF